MRALARKLPSMDIPDGITPAPEAAVLAKARAAHRPSLSMAAAARKAGVSNFAWRSAENGWRWLAAGEATTHRASAEALAAMAFAFDISPKELLEVGRGDAAAELKKLLRARDIAGPTVDLSNVDSDDLLEELRRRLHGESAYVPGPSQLAAARKLDPNDASTFDQD